MSKQDWLNTTAAAEFLKISGQKNLYGVAYGADDLEFAINTLHMAKKQWNEIVEYSKNKYVKQFIYDINNWDKNNNTLVSNFFV